MNRRDLLQKSLLGLGALLMINAAGLVNSVASVVLKAREKSLGYKDESPFPSKSCDNCRHYKVRDDEELGECVLVAMKNLMKADVVLVAPKGHCNMWAKILGPS
ncbi:MAG: hypothetical protein WCY48_08040 [Candidatus Caldatribacteriota bacterium]